MIQDAKTGAVSPVQIPRATAVMTPVTQVPAPNAGMVQMAKIAPATTALPTQLTAVLPATTISQVVAAGQPAVTAKTILPQSSLTPVHTHNVVMNPVSLQQMQRPAEVGKSENIVTNSLRFCNCATLAKSHFLNQRLFLT